MRNKKPSAKAVGVLLVFSEWLPLITARKKVVFNVTFKKLYK